MGFMDSITGKHPEDGAKIEAPTTRSYTAEDLKKAARELMTGKKCPHGRRVVVVSSHIEVRPDVAFGGTAARTTTHLVVEASCPHEEDQRSLTFEREL